MQATIPRSVSPVRALRRFFAGAFAGLAFAASTVCAQNFPTRPINVIYNNTPGSGPDVMGRLMATEAAKILGQSVIYENRTGANGRLIIPALKAAAGDGHVLGLVTDGLVISQPIADPAFQFEAGKDYEAVSVLFESPFVLAIRPGMAFTDLRGFIAYAKSNPGKINFSVTAGASSQFLAERFVRAIDVSVTLIPYKGGEAGVMAALGGQTDMLFSTSTAKPHVDSNKLLAVITTGSERWKLFPGVPTLRESGVAFTAASGYPLIAPPGTPRAVLARINRAFEQASRSPEIIKRIEEFGYTSLAGMSAEQTATYIRSEIEAWTPIIRKAGIKMN